MVVAIEDDISHALRLLLAAEKQDLLDIRGSQAIKVFPQVFLRADFG
jgi:hypothetical protein